jgi:hypothetical protein
MEDQFEAMRDQIEALTRLSNMGGPNGSGSGNPFAECTIHRCQHYVQAHTNRWVNGFKLDILKFQGYLLPKEFLLKEKNRKFPQKEVPRKTTEMVPKEEAEIKCHLVCRYIKRTCRKFQTTCTVGGKVAKLVIDQRSCESVVSEEAVRKLELQTKRHPTPHLLEWLAKGKKLTVSKHCLVSKSIGAKYRDTVWCDVVDI